jgi:putative DNA primase/helicase
MEVQDEPLTLPELFQKAKQEVYAELNREKKKTPKVEILLQETTHGNIPDCLKFIVTANPKTDNTNFNKLVLNLVTGFQRAGCNYQAALDIALPFLTEYPHSTAYSTSQARVDHFNSMWKYVEKKSAYSFDCSYILGLGFPGNAFECNDCEWFEGEKQSEPPINVPPEEKSTKELREKEPQSEETILKYHLTDEEKSELLFKDFSDTENARRFIKLNGNHFLWIEDLQKWWHYDPLRPGWDDGEMAVRSFMKKVANQVNQLVLEMPFTDDKQRLGKLKQCISWKDASGIENSIKMLRDESFTKSTKFDTNPFLFLCKSGVINLQTAKLESQKPSDYLHKMSPVLFDPEAKCPQWTQFLKDTFLEQKDLILFIKKFCGYTMTGDTREEKFLILEGPGANGKSTLLEVMAGVLGEYAVPIPFATFKDPKWDQGGNAHQADIVQMIGARFIRSIEVKERARLNIERLKSLTGNDEMSARPPYARDSIKFYPVGKIWLAVNHLPKIYDTTNSCWRRLLRIPFLYTVPPDKLIKDFSKKLLREESAGILNWMLDGCRTWQQEELDPIPSIVTDATAEYKLESTPVRRFISEKYETGMFQVACSDFYTSFLSWWKEEMGEIDPISKVEVGKELKRMGLEVRKINNVKCYIGLRPKVEEG